MRVALVQYSIAWQAPQENRTHLESLLRPLAGKTDLIVLPEMFSTGFSMETSAYAEPASGPTTRWLEDMAHELDAAITGSVMTEEGGRCYNRLLWAAPGAPLARYDKRHLFRMAREHEHYTPGRDAITLEWRGARICPLVCYDLRFPVFSRRRPQLEYDILIYVANWPARRLHAWRSLLVARAIENQAFVLGVNRVGRDGYDVDYPGATAAYDFLGAPLIELGSEPALAGATLDMSAVHSFRERFPAHLDADRFTLEP